MKRITIFSLIAVVFFSLVAGDRHSVAQSPRPGLPTARPEDDGGELDGARILGRKTVELMTTNHIGDLPVWLTGPGYGFGLGYSVVKDIGVTGQAGSAGQYGWGGAFCTYFQVDPKEELIGVMMTQVRPYTHINIRQEFMALANQAIVDNAKPGAMAPTRAAMR